MVTFLVVMGPSGCGKTTIAQSLANRLQVNYVEGDSFHSASNISKMTNGIPLTDEDRWPWLSTIRDYCSNEASKGKDSKNFIIVTCSALKKCYRIFLSDIKNVDRTIFVYPKSRFEVVMDRISTRKNHFMKASMLESQFATLEPPDEFESNVVIVNAELPIHEIIDHLVSDLIDIAK